MQGFFGGGGAAADVGGVEAGEVSERGDAGSEMAAGKDDQFLASNRIRTFRRSEKLAP